MKTTSLFRLLAVLCVFAVFGLRVSADSAPSLIVFDASGSMKERIGGELKIDIAKRAVAELVATLPDDSSLGLVVYSHRKPQDCADIELMIPPARLDREAFATALVAIKPKGRTPLAGAIEFAAEKLEYTRQPASIILVTDGLETCGQDPCAVAAKLKAAGVALVVHAVAFDLSSREAKSIACIAHATGGRFLQAKDAGSLKDALAVVAAETVAMPAAPTPPKSIEPPVTKAPPLPPAVTLKAPDQVDAGAAVSVHWTGPDASGDFITIVPKGAADDEDGNLAYTRSGSPLPLNAPVDAGDAEIRYVSGRDHAVLARRALRVLPVEITLEAPAEVVAGSEVKVTWQGPAYAGDYLVIVPLDAGAEFEASPAGVYQVPAVLVTAPMQAGPAEVRLHSGQNRKILGRCPIKVVEAAVTLEAPVEVVAGSLVRVVWKGPDNLNDHLCIVPRDHAGRSPEGFVSTVAGSPAEVPAPVVVGDCEVRYVSGQAGKVLARRPLRTIAAVATVSARAQVMAGSAVSVSWTGPDNPNDYLVLLPRAAADGEYSEAYSSSSTLAGSPVELRARVEAGPAEIRYVDGTDGHVVARRAIEVLEARATLQAPASAPAEATVRVSWTGPDGENDFLTIVPTGSSDDTVGARAWSVGGSPLEIETPGDPGKYEIRYVFALTGAVLERVPLELVK